MSSSLSQSVDSEVLRQKAAEAVRAHKASWFSLGQYLYTIHRDKLFREWSFLTFEAYCAKELRLKLATAQKLLKSYHFLEKEEPRFIKEAVSEEEDDLKKPVPNYESVNLLRLARENKNIEPADFAELREEVLIKAREPKDIKTKVKELLAAGEDTESEEAKQSRRKARIKRLVSLLVGAQRELASDGTVPKYLLKQIDDLRQKLEDQLSD
ncbi:MAG: hypothetical protein WC352_07620 [Candidatus Omnitrophota bacterium]|jgi:hypothetical protein